MHKKKGVRGVGWDFTGLPPPRTYRERPSKRSCFLCMVNPIRR